MNLLKSGLLIIAMLLSLSVSAGAQASGFSTDHVFSQPVSSIVTQSLADKISQQIRFNQSKLNHSEHDKPVFINDSQRSISHRSVLFLTNAQIEPHFELEFEFNPADLSTGRYDNSPITSIPWYLHANVSKTRVNGWKDGNSLYAACITYQNFIG